MFTDFLSYMAWLLMTFCLCGRFIFSYPPSWLDTRRNYCSCTQCVWAMLSFSTHWPTHTHIRTSLSLFLSHMCFHCLTKNPLIELYLQHQSITGYKHQKTETILQICPVALSIFRVNCLLLDQRIWVTVSCVRLVEVRLSRKCLLHHPGLSSSQSGATWGLLPRLRWPRWLHASHCYCLVLLRAGINILYLRLSGPCACPSASRSALGGYYQGPW